MAYETTDELLAEMADHWDKRHGSNIWKLFDSYNGALEEVSDTADKIEDWRQIKKAEGTTLDLIGKDYKAYRPSNNDDTFRFLIYIKTLLARANGTSPNLIHISSTALNINDEMQGWRIWQTGVRHIDITIPLAQLPDIGTEKFVLKNLQQLVALGIWLDKIRWTAESDSKLYMGADVTTSETYRLVADNV